MNEDGDFTGDSRRQGEGRIAASTMMAMASASILVLTLLAISYL